MKKQYLFLFVFIVAAIIGGASFFYLKKGGENEKGIISAQEAAQKAIDYINKNFIQGDTKASLIDVEEEDGVYKFQIKIGEQTFESYVTKNGKLLFPQAIDLDREIADVNEENRTTSSEIPKRDTPDVKLFVMSYCPFGLQAEKMFLPVYDLLGEKAQMGVYFVNYAMHGKKEIDENLRQYCIQKEEKEKYYDYLSCFVEHGDFKKCLSEAKIDKAKLADCSSNTDKEYKITAQYNDKNTWINGRFPRFDVNSDLNEKYKVQGSPTIVINDKVVNVSPRSPERFKEILCQAFKSEPSECSQALSKNVPSPGVGGGTDSSNTSGSCK